VAMRPRMTRAQSVYRECRSHFYNVGIGSPHGGPAGVGASAGFRINPPLFILRASIHAG